MEGFEFLKDFAGGGAGALVVYLLMEVIKSFTKTTEKKIEAEKEISLATIAADLKDLQEEVYLLRDENATLKQENQDYRKKLGIALEEVDRKETIIKKLTKQLEQ